MPVHDPPPNRRWHVGAALLCGATSALLVWAAGTRSPALRVTPIVAYLAAGVLAAAAARLMQLTGRAPGGGDGWAAVMLGGLAGVGAWIAFGPGARVCAVRSATRALLPHADVACRAPFGIGAVVAGLLAMYAGWRWLTARRAGARGPTRGAL